MRRLILSLFLMALPALPAWSASCYRFTISDPAITCHDLVDTADYCDIPKCRMAQGVAFYDNAGFFYTIDNSFVGTCPGGSSITRSTLVRYAPDSTTAQEWAYIQGSCTPYVSPNIDGLTFDELNGKLTVTAELYLGPPTYEIYNVAVDFWGFTPRMEVAQTYVPGPTIASAGSLEIRTPAQPHGFRSADSMQVWTGDVRSMQDWSQAQPLTCEAATNPAPGQVVTVADTLPDPALGHGRYYLTASVNGPDRRLGRQYSGGAFSARNPASLPVCAP